VFQAGNAKGDTFFASSGDYGTLGVSKQAAESTFYGYRTVGWPTSSPYVTSVGGTQLQYGWTWNPQSDVAFNADGSPNAAYFGWKSGRNLNAVWDESWLPAATGGGPSAIYARPAWQNGVLPSQGNHRLVPDLAWDAAVNGGALVYITAFPTYQRSGWHVYGGTSSSSPQVAGLTALAQQAAGHPLSNAVCNLNCALYSNPGAFTDVLPLHQGAANVISGDLTSNRMFDYNGDGLAVSWDTVPGWPTTPGYDLTTGWGTPNASAYVSALAGS
jgi:subtilase family serine protease